MPTIAELFALAVRFHQSGALPDAVALYREIIRADPAHADALNNLGDALGKLGRIAEAAECFQEALRLAPGHANAHYNLGNVFFGQGQHTQATDCYRLAVQFNPHHASMHVNLGNSLKDQNLFDEAIACYRRALEISPNLADAHNNMGLALYAQGRFPEAGACYQETLRLDPGHRMAQWNQSCLRLLQGDLAGGWLANEQRWARPGVVARTFPEPRWDGSPLEGKTILVFAEQGFGDTIQYARYLALVKRRGGKVLLECQPELADLLAGMSGVDQIVPPGAALPPFDVHIPLLSLPGIFGTTLATIPADVPYLKADPARTAFWRQELQLPPLTTHHSPPTPNVAVGSPLNIGIAWQGNPRFPGDSLRSVSLKYFKKLAQVPGIRLVSLQMEKQGVEQLRAWAENVPILDLSERIKTFGDTAAVMMNLDLVISSCTSVPHLAGALGVPVWTVLQFVPDWRWFLERSDSPWYPNMRLFRQKRPGAWGEVFERMVVELQKV